MPTSKPTLDIAGAMKHIAASSFPDEAEDLVGLELEWLVRTVDGNRPGRVPWGGVVDLALPGGSALSVEPGGQLELSSAPWPCVDAVCASIGTDTRALSDACARYDARLLGMGLAPDGPNPRLVSSPRYDAMAAFFSTDGHEGSTMMTATASTQVNVGLGPEAGREARWRRAHLLGPVLAAAFANSPLRHGVPSGFASTRLAVWSAIDPSRTASALRAGPARVSWPSCVLSARVMFIRRSESCFVPVANGLRFGRWVTDGHELGYPTAEDLDHHLTTMFPPVRPKGWLELRYLDGLPGPWWPVAAAVTASLLMNDEAGARAERAVRGLGDCWAEAARRGLGDPRLAMAARACFDVAAEALVDADDRTRGLVGEYVDRFVSRRRTPADDRLDAWRATGSPLLAEDAGDLATTAR